MPYNGRLLCADAAFLLGWFSLCCTCHQELALLLLSSPGRRSADDAGNSNGCCDARSMALQRSSMRGSRRTHLGVACLARAGRAWVACGQVGAGAWRVGEGPCLAGGRGCSLVVGRLGAEGSPAGGEGWGMSGGDM
jgi:hypothetical protein